ncbi:MAG: hypothetical protein HYZ50_02365 [Deltaproteobacteria bacterium]|nr:hypothetical protein [Deltaproteobacteria bacterium]
MELRSQNPEVLARELWSGTGLENLFPRDLERAVLMKLPLPLIKLPVLAMPAVETWLAGKRLALPLPPYHYDLFGCLIAHRGHGFLFVCSADSVDEQRLTLAHEVGHFLIDYLWPRQQAMRALGASITDVLDGVRKATPAERAAAVLSRLHVGAYVHLLPRPGTDEDTAPIIARTETRADRLALELLAPREQIHSFLHTLPARKALSLPDHRAALAVHFGLPVYAFTPIGQSPNEPRPISFLEDVRAALRRRQ